MLVLVVKNDQQRTSERSGIILQVELNVKKQDVSARFSRKVFSGKKPPAPKNLVAHLPIVPLTPKNLVIKITGKCYTFSGIKITPIVVTPKAVLL